ncbi:sn-glycerol-3-phosphate ABC transporter ATP-binding protein UgpC [Puniceicoccaceae bacterium K14]|nr:sn-glycerol-3-phosphate ABC transporter ATP-binding protein UgpC [Puniceicoccaceae bacterium K14]
MANVTLENLSKAYAGSQKNTEFHAVKNINLEIRDKEFMVLVGPSGCGKSTTLRMIAGLEEISGGTISIGENIVNDKLPKDRDIAMVFQNYALYPHMSVFDNMAFGLKIRKYDKRKIEERVKEAAIMLGLEDLLDRKPKALSGGQRQRVAVGRAIVRKPKVFLFDEPLSNLDAKMRVSTRTEIAKLHERLNATMIYVTHDQIEAMTMGDRICVMKDGLIQQVAEPLTLYNAPANLFVASFIGTPPMNLIHGKLESLENGTYFIENSEKEDSLTFKLDERLARIGKSNLGKSTVFGIRPEHIIEQSEGQSTADGTHELRVEISEPMGSETNIYLDTGAHQLAARFSSTSLYEANTRARIRFDFSKAHLFDSETEKRIHSE